MNLKHLLFDFSGRINRQPFWLATIAMSVAMVALIFGIMTLFGSWIETGPGSYELANMGPLGWILTGIVYIAGIYMSLAVAAKRWHDRGKSAWWILIAFIPIVGPIWYLVECGFLRGTEGPNKYGPDPLASR